MRITRRGLLIGAVSLAVLASAWLRELFTLPPPPAVQPSPLETLLLRRLDYLNLDPDGVAEFARHFAEAEPRDLRVLDATETAAPERAALEDEIVVLYLRSTDFFWNGADESRVVRFQRYYDPYSAACTNPFARLS
jgi:hypothetical protein